MTKIADMISAVLLPMKCIAPKAFTAKNADAGRISALCSFFPFFAIIIILDSF